MLFWATLDYSISSVTTGAECDYEINLTDMAGEESDKNIMQPTKFQAGTLTSEIAHRSTHYNYSTCLMEIGIAQSV
jgi:hypothetical protein